MKNKILTLISILLIASALVLSSCTIPVVNPDDSSSNSEQSSEPQNSENSESGSAASNEAFPPQTASDLNVYSINANAGDTVELPVVLSNNPGMVSLQLRLQYNSSVMSLSEIRDGNIMGKNSSSDNLKSVPYVLSWENDTLTENITTTGTLVTLVFKINSDAQAGSYPIEISYNKDNYEAIDVNMNAVEIGIANGAIIIK